MGRSRQPARPATGQMPPSRMLRRYHVVWRKLRSLPRQGRGVRSQQGARPVAVGYAGRSPFHVKPRKGPLPGGPSLIAAAVLWLRAGHRPRPRRRTPGRRQPSRRRPPKAATYVGSQTCQACHEDIFNAFQKSPHSVVETDKKRGWEGKACESCHGPGSKHAESADRRRHPQSR